MEKEKLKFKKISVGVAMTDKTNVDQLVDNLEYFMTLCKERGITGESETYNGVTLDKKGDGVDD